MFVYDMMISKCVNLPAVPQLAVESTDERPCKMVEQSRLLRPESEAGCWNDVQSSLQQGSHAKSQEDGCQGEAGCTGQGKSADQN